jgi:hypothetical protein
MCGEINPPQKDKKKPTNGPLVDARVPHEEKT